MRIRDKQERFSFWEKWVNQVSRGPCSEHRLRYHVRSPRHRVAAAALFPGGEAGNSEHMFYFGT